MSLDNEQSHQASHALLETVLKRLDEARINLSFLSLLPAMAGGYFSQKHNGEMPIEAQKQYFQHSFWASPMSGLIIGALAWAFGTLSSLSGVEGLNTFAALLCLTAVTGGLHEDGLADLADACGGKDKQSRLQIMKDSRIGSFGVTALILWFLCAFITINHIQASNGLTVIILAAVSSRAVLPLMILLLPKATNRGLGHHAQLRDKATVMGACIAISLGLAPALILGHGLGLLGLFAAQMIPLFLALRFIGGTTGDVFGACQKMGELGFYIGSAIAFSNFRGI